MRAKDVALLGFVAAAGEFVKNNPDKVGMIDLSNEELQKVKDEMNLDFSLDAANPNDILMEEGRRFFDKYINDKCSVKEDILSEFEGIFDLDLDEQIDDNVIENEEDADAKIAELLSDYESEEVEESKFEDETQEETVESTLEDKKEEIHEPILEETKEEVEEAVFEDTNKVDLEETEELNIEEVQEEPVEQIDDFGIADDDEFLNQIAFAAAKSDEELKNYNNHLDVDEIISDVIAHEKEKALEKEDKPIKMFEDVEDEKEDSADEIVDERFVSLSDRLRKIGKGNSHNEYVLNPLYNLDEEEINEHKNDNTKASLLSGFKNYKDKEEVKEELKPQEEVVKEEVVQKHQVQEEPIIEEPQEDTDRPFIIIENPGVDAIETDEAVFIETPEVESQEETVEKETENSDGDTPIDETVNKVSEAIKALDNINKEKQADENNNDDEYVESLISDLKNKIMSDKESNIRKNEENKNEVYERIAKIYANLSDGFIRAVYDLKEPLAKQYAIGETVIVLHRANFSNLDRLREFVEVMMSHNYSVNVDEKKMIVDTFKEFVNTDGKILQNIFELANQTKVLNGNYEGYRVIKREN